MYRPSAFASNDVGVLVDLIARDPLATLITTDAHGRIAATPVPILLEQDGEALIARGHLAKANPQVGHAGEALLILTGPMGYVSPSWYPDKVSAHRVPTWNYVTAHLRGVPHWQPDIANTAAIVDALSVREESALGSDWRFEPDNPAMVKQLGGIVGFTLAVEQQAIKLKLSQNHPPANVRGVIHGLQTRGRPADIELARWMQAHAPNEES